jgi:hypothetical protein
MEEAEDPGLAGGLGAMRLMMSGQGLPGQEQLDKLADQPIMDPSNKWLHFAAGALRPTQGGRFGDEMSNALGALAGANDKEAELRAKYMPIIASALLQRQQMAFSMATAQTKLTAEWDGLLTAGLTGLLTQPNVTHEQVMGVIKGNVLKGRVPLQFAQQYANLIPTDPRELRSYIMSKSVSAQNPEARQTSVTPKIDITGTGGSQTPMNTNPLAGPVGPTGPGFPNTPTIAESKPTVVETPQGPMAHAPLTGKAGPVGSPEGVALTQEAVAGAGRPLGVPPGAPQPLAQQPPTVPGAPPGAVPGPGGAPSRSLAQNAANNKAELDSGANFAKYEETVNMEVAALRSLKAGALVKDMAQVVGVPDTQADALGKRVAGGDVAAMQEAQKLTVQGAMEQLRAAAGSGQRFTQFEYDKFLRANPGLVMDPKAMEKIHNFIAEQYRRASTEQNFLNTKRAQGVPVVEIPAMWDQEFQKTFGRPTRTENIAVGSIGKPSTAQISTDTNGAKIKLVDGIWVYEE